MQTCRFAVGIALALGGVSMPAIGQLQLGQANSGWLISTTNPTNSTNGSNLLASGGGSTGGGVGFNSLTTQVDAVAFAPGEEATGAFARLEVLVQARFLAQGVFTDCFSQQRFTVNETSYFDLSSPYGSLPPSGFGSTTMTLRDANGGTPAGVLLPGVVYTLRVNSNFVFSGAPVAVALNFDHAGFINLYSTPVPAPSTAVVGAVLGVALLRRRR